MFSYVWMVRINYVMLCHRMSRCVMLRYINTRYVMVCHDVSCYIMLYYGMSCYVMFCNVMSWYRILCHGISWHAILSVNKLMVHICIALDYYWIKSACYSSSVKMNNSVTFVII